MRTLRFLFAIFIAVISAAPVAADAAPPATRPALADPPPKHSANAARATRGAERTPAPTPIVVPPANPAPVNSPDAAPPPVVTTSTVAQHVAPVAPKPAVSTAPAPKSVPVPAAVAASSGGGKPAVANIARAQVGKAYRSGATGPSAFDCSGLVYYVYNQAGINMPRLTSYDFLSKYQKVSRSDLQAGDLVVSSGHVGIYVGDGMMVHASTPRGGVKLSPIDSPGSPQGFARP